jgi:hypothetical protein
MSRYVRFHPEARLEVLDIAQHAGHDVVELLDETVARISLMPYAWPLWPGGRDVRQRVLTTWPYSVMYTVDAASLFIVAVAHQKRAPGYWLSRL